MSRRPARVRALHRGQTYELLAPEPRHARALVEAIHASLPELRAFMPFGHLPHSVDSQFDRLVTVQADFWAGRDAIFHLFGPLGATPSALLGCFGLHRRTLNPRALELGYWTRSDVAGRGLATFAAQCLVVVCFEWLGCERVQCAHNASNTGSRRVNEKVGFREEAVLRGFEPRPTAEMIANGAVLDDAMVLRGLLPEHRETLPWYADVRRGLEVWDWEGAPWPVD